MKSESGMVRLLVVVAAILAVVVIGDRVLKARASDEDTASPRARYLDKAKVVDAKRDLVAHTVAWATTLDEARSAWTDTRQLVVEAPTPELAVAGFRDDVLAATSGFDLPVARAASTKSEPIVGAPGMHLLEVRLELQSYSVPDVLRVIDRLENLPHRLTGVSEVRLDGPGQNTAGRELGATVIVQSIGYVEAGGGI